MLISEDPFVYFSKTCKTIVVDLRCYLIIFETKNPQTHQKRPNEKPTRGYWAMDVTVSQAAVECAQQYLEDLEVKLGPGGAMGLPSLGCAGFGYVKSGSWGFGVGEIGGKTGRKWKVGVYGWRVERSSWRKSQNRV